MVTLNINELIEVIVEYITTTANSGAMTSTARAVMVSTAVCYGIYHGLELYFNSEGEGRLGQFIWDWASRTAFAVFFLETYEYFFYEVLWQGVIHDVAYELGSLYVLDYVYELVLSLLGNVVVGGILSIAGALGAMLVAGMMLVACGVGYAVILIGLGEAVLVAGSFLVIGKLFACLLFFDFSRAWFFGWWKGYLGALFGIAMFYFFLGAFAGLPWENAISSVQSIDELAESLNEVFNVMVMVLLTGFVALRCSTYGQKLLG